jgi:aminoglycoside phosphotransferase family enzyme
MAHHSCQWILLPSRADKRQRLCNNPVETNSRYCPAHRQELLTVTASNVDSAVEPKSKLSTPDVISIDVLQQRDLSGAQFEANVALDDIYAAVQRIRDLVNRANTRRKKAWDMSLWSRENELRRATSRLHDVTKIIRKLLRH